MRYLKNKGLILLLFIYLFITIIFSFKSASIYANIINPIFWTAILIYLIFDIKKNYIRFEKNKKYTVYMLMLVVIYVVIFFYLGFIFGFVKSPYNHKIESIIKNIVTKIIPIIGIEIARFAILNRNKTNKLAVIFVTILLVFLELNYASIINVLSNRGETFEYICSTIIPLIIASIVYSNVVLKASLLPIILFRIFINIATIISPIFPDIDWYIIGSYNILFFVIVYLLFKYKLAKEVKEDIRKRKQKFLGKFCYIITILFSINLVCFMLGFFKYEAISIVSNSMSSVFEIGDVVIYKKQNEKELNEIPKGTIIIYEAGDRNIAHRIVNVVKNDDSTSYQTKGDRNNAPDSRLVKTNQIKGVYVFHIKYIGFPSILLYSFLNMS